MTTIAYDGKTLAVDSLVSSGNVCFGYTKKIFRLKGGRHVALCGDLALYPAVIDWLNGGEPPTLAENEDIGGLVVDAKGRAMEFSSRLRLHEACIPWAGGSGEPIALTALMCGKTAAEAVKMACLLDKSTGGRVRTVAICR